MKASGGGATTNGVNGAGKSEGKAEAAEDRLVNVLATGSVDQSVKVWLP